MLEVVGLRKTFKSDKEEVFALDDVSLFAEPGEIVTLLGPSGCGKTTTLRCIAGLEHPNSGEIHIDGSTVFSSAQDVDTKASQRKLAMVFQSYAIWPHMTVFRNVAFPLRAAKVPRSELEQRVQRALEMVGLAHAAQRPATKLSGGQQQRVALARAIVQRSSLLLLDEPLSNLDAALRIQMRSELKSIQREVGTTSIYVTHDQEEAMSLSDRVYLFKDGRIVDSGIPEELYLRPKSNFAACFLGAANILSVRGITAEAGHFRATLENGLSFAAVRTGALPSGEINIMVRPEHVEISETALGLSSSPNLSANGTIVRRSFSGNLVDYTVNLSDQFLEIRAQTLSHKLVPVGAKVTVNVPAENCIVVDAEVDEKLNGGMVLTL